MRLNLVRDLLPPARIVNANDTVAKLSTHRPDASSIDDALDMRDREVGNTDGFNLARVEELDHRLPRIHEARRRVDSDPASLVGILGLEVCRAKRNGRERNGPVNDYVTAEASRVSKQTRTSTWRVRENAR